MRKAGKLFLMLVLSAFAVVSCNKDKTIFYNDQTMADIVNGEVLTDSDLYYNIVEDQTDGLWKNEKRVYLVSDILVKTAENRYDIRLRQYHKVLFKKALKMSEMDEKAVGNDTTFVRNVWVGKNKVNILASFPFHDGKNTKHFINLVYDDRKSDKDNLYFELKRNSNGDPVKREEIELGASNLRINNFFFSATFDEFLIRPDQNVYIIVNNGSNKASRE